MLVNFAYLCVLTYNILMGYFGFHVYLAKIASCAVISIVKYISCGCYWFQINHYVQGMKKKLGREFIQFKITIFNFAVIIFRIFECLTCLFFFLCISMLCIGFSYRYAR